MNFVLFSEYFRFNIDKNSEMWYVFSRMVNVGKKFGPRHFTNERIFPSHALSKYSGPLAPEGNAAMSQTTKRALESSLKRLLLQKPLDKITVSQLAADCGINRMTFYYHFKDIYDLVEWCCTEDVRRALEGKFTYDTWQEGFLNIFRLAETNKAVVLNIYRGASQEQLRRYLGPFVRQLVRYMVEQLAQELSVDEEDKQFIARFYEYALVGILLDWVQGDMREDPVAIVDRTSVLIRGNIRRALEAFRADRIPKENAM